MKTFVYGLMAPDRECNRGCTSSHELGVADANDEAGARGLIRFANDHSDNPDDRDLAIVSIREIPEEDGAVLARYLPYLREAP